MEMGVESSGAAGGLQDDNRADVEGLASDGSEGVLEAGMAGLHEEG